MVHCCHLLEHVGISSQYRPQLDIKLQLFCVFTRHFSMFMIMIYYFDYFFLKRCFKKFWKLHRLQIPDQLGFRNVRLGLKWTRDKKENWKIIIQENYKKEKWIGNISTSDITVLQQTITECLWLAHTGSPCLPCPGSFFQNKSNLEKAGNEINCEGRVITQ